MSVILRITGRHAGALLALETGLHRHIEPTPKVAHSTFKLRMLSIQRAAMEPDELDAPCARTGPAPAGLERKLAPSVREVHRNEVRVDDKRGRVEVTRDSYWSHIEAIALTHLLLLEERLEDRSALFASPLDAKGYGLEDFESGDASR